MNLFNNSLCTTGTPANFNEIRMEDKNGLEQVYIHTERNQDIVVEVDESHSVGHDRNKHIRHDEVGEHLRLVCGRSVLELNASGQINLTGV